MSELRFDNDCSTKLTTKVDRFRSCCRVRLDTVVYTFNQGASPKKFFSNTKAAYLK
jgi:hypothetical protein